MIYAILNQVIYIAFFFEKSTFYGLFLKIYCFYGGTGLLK